MKAKVISDIAMKNHVVLMVIFPIGWPKTVLWLYPYSKNFIHTLLVFPQTLSHGFPLTLTTSVANSLFHFHTVSDSNRSSSNNPVTYIQLESVSCSVRI